MKKWLIGSFVGAILIFVWQFLSWTVFQLHEAEARYTPAQDSVLRYLNSHLYVAHGDTRIFSGSGGRTG